jgi:hypothetical protein
VFIDSYPVSVMAMMFVVAVVVPAICIGGDETHEEAKEDNKLFRDYGRTGQKTRGQSDRYV